MTTINITPVASIIPEAVDKKDFLGALETCDPVNNIITIKGKQYTLNSVDFGIVSTFEKAIIAHAGGGQADATLITKNITRIDVCANDNDSVKMFAAKAGFPINKIYNNTAKDVAFFPLETENFLGKAADESIIIPAGESIELFPFEDKVWTY